MKLINILWVALVAVSANCHRHHRRHSHFSPIGLSDMSEIFNMMNDLSAMTPIKDEIKIETVELAPAPVAKVGGKYL